MCQIVRVKSYFTPKRGLDKRHRFSHFKNVYNHFDKIYFMKKKLEIMSPSGKKTPMLSVLIRKNPYLAYTQVPFFLLQLRESDINIKVTVLMNNIYKARTGRQKRNNKIGNSVW